MDRIYTDYTASGHQVVLNNAASLSSMTVENLRLVANETQAKILTSTTKKANVSSVVYNSSTQKVTITLVSTTPTIVSTDKLTIKIDMGENGSSGGGTIPVATDAEFQAMLDEVFNDDDE